MKKPALRILRAIAVLMVAGQKLSIAQERDTSAPAIGLAPVSLVPQYGLDQTSIIPNYRIEASLTLSSWEPTGETMQGGIVEELTAIRPIVNNGVREQYYRLVSAGLDLSGANLTDHSLVMANLAGADLSNADLSYSDLSGADLTGANLSGANLAGVDLRGANLQNANLTGAILDGANLIGVELTDAQKASTDLEDAIEEPVEDFAGWELVDGFLGQTWQPAPGGNIGFSTGGAKDINNFRDNIDEDFLPLVTDVTYEGLFYDYFFDTGQSAECEELFCPSYTFAASGDPMAKETEYFLSVGLNSGISEAEFTRKHLNLVIVLDVSGSMSSPFNQYYYDNFGKRQELDEAERVQIKMEIANQAVVALLNHLDPEDRLAIVTFNNEATVTQPMALVGDTDLEALKTKVLNYHAGGGTNMSAGMQSATEILDDYLEVDRREFENRVIFLTDAQPNLGILNENSLLGLVKANADKQNYATLIGIGLDFNTELVEEILKTRGANYYAVHSPSQFVERMGEGFDFMVTPLVFDLNVKLSESNFTIAEVYGSPEAEEATGDVMKVKTLFPSKTVEGETRGGLVLLKLAAPATGGIADQPAKLSVSYEDRLGEIHQSEILVELPQVEADFYQNAGIRKGILLSRYGRVLRAWIEDERAAYEENKPVVEPSPFPVDDDWWKPIFCLECPPIPPRELGRWERQSVPLFVARPYRKLFGDFLEYFVSEANEIGDETLLQEADVLKKLSSIGGSDEDGGEADGN